MRCVYPVVTYFRYRVTLPLGPELKVQIGEDVALRDSHNELLAVMTVEEIYETDLNEVAQNVFGTTDSRHPAVAELHRSGPVSIAGKTKNHSTATAL